MVSVGIVRAAIFRFGSRRVNVRVPELVLAFLNSWFSPLISQIQVQFLKRLVARDDHPDPSILCAVGPGIVGLYRPGIGEPDDLKTVGINFRIFE